MSKILLKSQNNITQNSGTKQKVINIRKPINKIMNIDNFISKNNLSRSPRVDSKISLYSFQKSYVSPTVSSLLSHNSKKLFSKKVSPQKSKQKIIKPSFIYFNNRNKSPKQANSNISPVKQSNNLLNQNIKKKLYNQRNIETKIPKNKTNDKAGSKKYSFNIQKKKNELNVNIKKKINNYKNKIIINKEKLKNINSKMILNSMTDTDNSYSFRNNSSEANDKVRQAKKSNDIINDLNSQDRTNKEEFNNLFLSSNDSAKRENNTNVANNNIFDVGSISNISKNGSGSAKGKNIEDVGKSNNNNAFEIIINEFAEEGKCNNLFNERTDNIKNNDNKNNNIENKDDVNNDNGNLGKENNINKEIINEEKNNNNEIINANGSFGENENLEKIRINNENKENSIDNIIINKIIDKNAKLEDEKENEEKVVDNNLIDNDEANENDKNEIKEKKKEIKEIKDENLDNFDKNDKNEIEEINSNKKEENGYDNNIGNENDIDIISKNENNNEVLVMNENEENKNMENIENEVEEKENCENINKSNDNHLKENNNNSILNIEENEEKKDDENNIELNTEVDNKEITNENNNHHEKEVEPNSDDIKNNTKEEIDINEENNSENYPNENINLNIINGLPKNICENKNKIMKINNLIKSVEIPIISKKIEHIPNDKNDLLQSVKNPNIRIILTKYNIYPDLGVDFNPNSVRRQYQRRRNKSVTHENLQILYDNSYEEKRANSYTNRSYENLYKKAKILSDSKKRKSIPLNAKSKQINMSIIKNKLKNIILKEPIKRCKSIKTIKYFFKKFKYLLNKKSLCNEKDNNIIINTAVYKADPNQENEKMYKLPSDENNTKEEHYGYYDSNIAICHPIKVTIKNGVFFVINDNKVDESHFNIYRDTEEDMEIFVVKDVKNRNFAFQKNGNYTFGGTY